MANDGTVKIGTELDDSGFKSGLSKLGGVAKAAVGGITAGLAGATAAVGALTKSALDAYASYEQLTGGIETLFGAGGKTIEEYAASVGKSVDEVSGDYQMLMDRQEQVFQNAANAYKTAGMSANEYMETVTGFSASLIQSLGEYSWQAASYADQAITDMSDNANKMGTDIEAIQYAYQGFAKQNYTMLDNLKLGYGGTKEEMDRLLRDAEKLGGYIEGSLDISSFADIVDAIHIVQEELGITGTTAKEASTTIEGALKATKAAWENLLVGIADDDANLDELINNFVESVGTAASNILPRIETILGGIGELISKLAPIIVEAIPTLIEEIVPPLVEAAGEILLAIAEVLPELISTLIPLIIQFFTENIAQFIEIGIQIITAIVNGIAENISLIIEAIPKIIEAISNALSENGPELLEAGGKILEEIINGIIKLIPEISRKLPEVITAIIEFISKNLPTILEKGTEILNSIITGILEAIPDFVAKLPEIITAFVNFIAENLPTIVESGISVLLNLIEGILKAIPELVKSLPQIIEAIVNGIVNLLGSVVDVGKNIVEGIWEGISSMASWIGDKVSGFFSGIVDGAKSLLGIASPSKVFAQIGGFMAEGLGVGWDDEFSDIQKDINKSLDFSAAIQKSIPIVRSVASSMVPRGVFGGQNVTNNTNSSMVFNISVSGASNREEARNIGREIGAEAQREMRRRGLVMA